MTLRSRIREFFKNGGDKKIENQLEELGNRLSQRFELFVNVAIPIAVALILLQVLSSGDFRQVLSANSDDNTPKQEASAP